MNYKLYTNNENKTRAICLGYFDGIHLGHQLLMDGLLKEKQKGRNKEEIQSQWEKKRDLSGNKYKSINNFLKCQWTKCSN